jgi:uncharacterized protein YegL
MGYYYKNQNGVNRSKIENNYGIKFSGWLFLVLFILSVVIFGSLAGSVRGDSTGNPEIEYLDYVVIIDSNYAITQVEEMFKNPYDHGIDQTFEFQIPEKAYISNFSMTVDGVIHYAEIVPKDEGAERYSEAAMSGTDAGLVEAKGKNVFSYSVSLSPYQEILLGLRYEQFIEKKLGGYEYTIPLSGNNFKYNIKSFSVDLFVRSEQFLTQLNIENYPEAENSVEFIGRNVGTSFFKTSGIPKKDFIVSYEIKSPPVNGTMINFFDGTEGYFFHVFSPQRFDLGGSAMDKEIIFVLDKSGSMQGKKISQLKQAFGEIIYQLPDKDSFNIIMFDNSIKKYNSELLSAELKNKNDANDYIDDISASGSTNINDAMVSALNMFQYSETKVPIIVMLTDGLPTAGVTNPSVIRENIKEKNTAKVGIFSLGFGYDVDFEFLKAMSLENNGLAFRIYEGEDASEQITNFYETISTPLLRNLVFSYSDGCYEVYPQKLDQLFEGTEAVVVGKYNTDTSSITSEVEATSWEGYKAFNETFKLNESTNHSFIPRLWAFQKINYLINELTVQGKNESLKENITDLALKYSFVTPYTSLLIEITDTSSGDSEDTNKEEKTSSTEPDNDNNPDSSQDNTPASSTNPDPTPPRTAPDYNKPKKESEKKDDAKSGSDGGIFGDDEDNDILGPFETEEAGAGGLNMISIVLCFPIIIIGIIILIILVVKASKKRKNRL